MTVDRTPTGRRGQSDVLGFILIFALVLSTVTVVAVFGFGTLEDTRDQEELNNAERAFDVLRDNMADIHEEGAPSRATEISLERAQLYPGDQVTFNVTAVDGTGNSVVNILSYSPVVFANGDTEIVYSAGAVIRNQRDGGVMLQKPPLLLNESRVVIPVVQTRYFGDVDSTSGGTIRVRAEQRRRQPLGRLVEAPTDYQSIHLNVTSPRSDIWQSYFESEGLDCEAPRPNIVDCSLDDPEEMFISRTLIRWEIET
jgi:hypothetical protein